MLRAFLAHTMCAVFARKDRLKRKQLLTLACGAFMATAGILVPSQSAVAVTIVQSKAFFQDFDAHTLTGKGDFIGKGANAIFTSAVAWSATYNKVSPLLTRGLVNQMITANGKALTQAQVNAYAATRTTALAGTRLAKTSELQLAIIKKHFPGVGPGGIKWDDFQTAMEHFANGELRPTNEMNQQWMFYMWKRFSEEAISAAVDTAQWEKAIRSIQEAAEIYEIVYPSGVAANFADKLIQSNIADFTMANQLNAAAKTNLRNTINNLANTAMVIGRQNTKLNALTTWAFNPVEMNGAVNFRV